jgi:hypothetical protein
LVKCSFLYINGSKRPVLLTCIIHIHIATTMMMSRVQRSNSKFEPDDDGAHSTCHVAHTQRSEFL